MTTSRFPWVFALIVLAGGCGPSPDSSDNGGSGGSNASGSGGAAGGGRGGNGSGGSAGSTAGGKGGFGGHGGSGGDPTGSGGNGTPDAGSGGGGGANGGSSGQDASTQADRPSSTVDMKAADTAAPALEECKTPSIDRIQKWNATGEGTTSPMSGSLLVKDPANAGHYIAKESFLKNSGDPWHVLEILIGNAYDDVDIDLSKSSGFDMTYSSTADLLLQLRPGFNYSGGAQWVTKVPSTAGKVVTTNFPFDPTKWIVSSLGKPSWTYDMARKDVRGFLLVGDTLNTITISSLRIDGYVPPCK